MTKPIEGRIKELEQKIESRTQDIVAYLEAQKASIEIYIYNIKVYEGSETYQTPKPDGINMDMAAEVYRKIEAERKVIAELRRILKEEEGGE